MGDIEADVTAAVTPCDNATVAILLRCSRRPPSHLLAPGRRPPPMPAPIAEQP
jgi:hypothetical protein